MANEKVLWHGHVHSKQNTLNSGIWTEWFLSWMSLPGTNRTVSTFLRRRGISFEWVRWQRMLLPPPPAALNCFPEEINRFWKSRTKNLGVLSADKLRGVRTVLPLRLAANERSIHIPPHPPHDKPVSALIVMTTTKPCKPIRSAYKKGHPYFIRLPTYLTKGFISFLVNWNHASFFIRLSESLGSVVRWAACFIHVLWTSACLGVKKSSNSQKTPAWLVVNELRSPDSKQPVRAPRRQGNLSAQRAV